VYRRPRVVILLVRGAGAGDLDAACKSVAGLTHEWGGEVVARRTLDDHPTGLAGAASAALDDARLVVVVGAAWKAMFAPFGLRVLCDWRSDVGDGQAWTGRVGDRFAVGLAADATVAQAAGALLAPLLAAFSGRTLEASMAWPKRRRRRARGTCRRDGRGARSV
jgi:hypothetical protein